MSSEITLSVTYVKYDDFRLVNSIFSQKFDSLFCGLFNDGIDLLGKVVVCWLLCDVLINSKCKEKYNFN
jgi:hypothetical protein